VVHEVGAQHSRHTSDVSARRNAPRYRLGTASRLLGVIFGQVGVMMGCGPKSRRRQRLATHLKLPHCPYVLDTQLDHVQHTPVEHPREDQVVWPLLGVQASDEQTRVVLLREELKRGGRVERVDVVLSRKVYRLRPLERVLKSAQLLSISLARTHQVLHRIPGLLGSAVPSDEDGRLLPLDLLRLSLVQRSLHPRIFRLSTRQLRFLRHNLMSSHCPKHRHGGPMQS